MVRPCRTRITVATPQTLERVSHPWRRHRRPARTLAASPALERRPVCLRTGAYPSHALDDAGIHHGRQTRSYGDYRHSCDRRQRALSQGPAHRGRLFSPRVRQDAGGGDRGRRLRLGRPLQAQRGRAQRRRRVVQPAPARGRGRPQGAPAAQARALRRQPLPHPQVALVRRRRGRRRDRRDQPVRGARLRHHGSARPRLRAALGALPARGPGGSPHSRAWRGGLRGLRHGGRRLHRRGRRARGRRRRDRDLGLLPRPHRRLDPHLRAQARDQRGAPRRDAAARADAEVRRRGGPRRRARGRAVLPGRPRPPQPGRRDRGQPRRTALHGVRRALGTDHRPAERRHAEDLGRGRRWRPRRRSSPGSTA